MKHQLKSFIESICIDSELKLPLIKGLDMIFEGRSDMENVFDINALVDDIKDRFASNRHSFKSTIQIQPIGFQYTKTNTVNNNTLNIRWMKYHPDHPQNSHFNPENNFIFIIMNQSSGYDQSISSILNNIEDTKDTLTHEVMHWIDFNKNKLDSMKYTRMSAIEKPELKTRISDLYKSIADLTGDQYKKKLNEINSSQLTDSEYANSLSEINAHITELIHVIIEEYLMPMMDSTGRMRINKNIMTFDEMLSSMNSALNFDDLTIDSKKRLYKRLYVFHKALDNINPILVNSSDTLKQELIKYFNSVKGEMKSVIKPQHESIEYTHTDIINHKNIVIFEANYLLDNEYKNWFDNKYIKKNARLPIPIIESLNYIKSIT